MARKTHTGAGDQQAEGGGGGNIGERSSEESGSGLDARQSDTEGGIGGKLLSPTRLRQYAEHLMEILGVSERRACRTLGHPRSTWGYEPRPVEDSLRLCRRWFMLP